MDRITKNLTLAALLALALMCSVSAGSPQGPSGVPRREPTTMSAAAFETMFKATSNWGRWGKDDAVGSINLITEAKRRQAGALVKTGISVSVSHPLSTEAAPDNPRPLVQVLAPNFRSDTYTIAYHGTFVTHIDALCHYSYNNEIYNGRPIGAAKGCFPGVDQLQNGIVTRGVLIDIPRLRGVPYLEPGTPIFADEVEAWEKKVGVKIGPGDAVILRTGRWARRAKVGPWVALGDAAGFDVTMGRWIKARDVAIAGGDVSVEVQTAKPYVEGQLYPLHTLFIAGLGMPIIDSFDPEALAETAARLNRWEFQFVVAPLAVPGGTGSPVNAIAIF